MRAEFALPKRRACSGPFAAWWSAWPMPLSIDAERKTQSPSATPPASNAASNRPEVDANASMHSSTPNCPMCWTCETEKTRPIDNLCQQFPLRWNAIYLGNQVSALQTGILRRRTSHDLGDLRVASGRVGRKDRADSAGKMIFGKCDRSRNCGGDRLIQWLLSWRESG